MQLKDSPLFPEQGDENEIVIVSLVRSNANGSVGFLKDLERRSGDY